MKPARVIYVSNAALTWSTTAMLVVAFLVGWFIGSIIANA
jgi:hypothetical protein